jgi:hypothetical protein
VRYVTLRELHLALGTFAAPFLLVYAVSALQMAHPALRFGASEERSWEVALAPGTRDPVAVHEALRGGHDVRGDLVSSRIEGSALLLEVARPGRRYAIEVDAASGRVRVSETVETLTRLLNRLHHARGLSHREPAAAAWGAAVVGVSFGLLGLVASGAWMGWLRPRERRVGLAVFGASTAFALALLAAIRLG